MAGPAAEPEPQAAGEPAAPRPGLLPIGALGALVGAALGLTGLAGRPGLGAAVLVLQVVLLLGVLALADAPADGGAFAIGAGAALAADGLALAGHGRVGGLAGVVGLGLVAALLHQLARRRRARVTEALADTMVVVVLVACAACLLAARSLPRGREALVVAMVAAGAALLAGRLGDVLAPRPSLAVGASRGWPGLVLALGVGVAAATAAGAHAGVLAGRPSALVGLVVAAAVAAGDLAVDLTAAELRGTRRDARRVAALRPVALLLPYAVAGPVALLACRLALPAA